MKKVSWTLRCEDGVKREVRVELRHKSIKWQFKRRDEETWDYDSEPTKADWDALEDVLKRRAGRGRDVTMIESYHKLRRKSNV